LDRMITDHTPRKEGDEGESSAFLERTQGKNEKPLELTASEPFHLQKDLESL
jgi:hypothetical protein